jgi:F-type H+-transporting ATPase subunit b
MNIIPDLMLTAANMLPFLVLVAGLQMILYKPMLDYLEARRHATIGARKEAEELQAKAAARLAEWEAALGRARNEVAEYRGQRRSAANVKYQKIVADARAVSEAHIAQAVTTIQDEAKVARGELAGAARTLSRDVATQVLGRPLTSLEA